MWSCHKCGKAVFFAERKQSLGYDWHPECLRCEECGKRLNPGQHAEHKGEPYCHVPCYGVLFGPTLFGHGSQVESHTSFGKVEKKIPPGVDRAILEARLKSYNQYFDGNRRELKWRERNGKLVLEGVLRIYWGVNHLIHLKENDDQRHHVQLRKRYSYREPSTSTRVPNNNDAADTSENGTHSLSRFNTLPNRKQRQTWSDSSAINKSENAGHCRVESSVNDDLFLPTSNEVPNLEVAKPPSNCNETESHSLAKGDVVKTTDSVQVVTEAALLHDRSLDVGMIPEGDSKVEAAVLRTCEESESSRSSSLVTDFQHSESKEAFEVENYLLLSDDDDVKRPRREKVDLSRVQIRKLTSSRSKTKLRRRCSINGHYYNRETKTFTPPHGSATNVWITSLVDTTEVINLLLDKFRVENPPHTFALFVVRDNGEIRKIKDDDFPLLERVLVGPHEDVAKVFIMDNTETHEISNEVAQYLNFQEPELAAILDKFFEEEAREARKIKQKYAEMRRIIKMRLAVLQAQAS